MKNERSMKNKRGGGQRHMRDYIRILEGTDFENATSAEFIYQGICQIKSEYHFTNQRYP